jgi:hypothetical protein
VAAVAERVLREVLLVQPYENRHGMVDPGLDLTWGYRTVAEDGLSC